MHEKENFVFDGGFSMIKKNDLFEAEITAMTAEGSGICRADGMAVFVPVPPWVTAASCAS